VHMVLRFSLALSARRGMQVQPSRLLANPR